MSNVYNAVYHAAYYLKNKERIKAIVKAGRKPVDLDKKKVNSARYYARHADEIKVKAKAYKAKKRLQEVSHG